MTQTSKKTVSRAGALSLLLTAAVLLPGAPGRADADSAHVSRGLLFDVEMVTSDDGWAVGSQRDRAFAMHWDGVAWQPAPIAPGGAGSDLGSLAAIASNDVWALGEQSDDDAYRLLVEHWNGREWSVVPTPDLPVSAVSPGGIDATSSDDVWIVGYGDIEDGLLIEHWDGTEWTVSPLPGPVGRIDGALYGVAAISPNDVWAVGTVYRSHGGNHTLALHWDGVQWRRVGSPGRFGANSQLLDVDATVEAAPRLVGSNDEGHQLIAHWDGERWRRDTTSPIAGRHPWLADIGIIAADDIWTVGFVTRKDYHGVPVTEHFDGQAWQVVSTPKPTRETASLNAVSGVGSDDVWAVGSYRYKRHWASVIQHWDGARWKLYAP